MMKTKRTLTKVKMSKGHVIIGENLSVGHYFICQEVQGLGIWQKHQNVMGHLCIHAKLDKDCEVVKRPKQK